MRRARIIAVAVAALFTVLLSTAGTAQAEEPSYRGQFGMWITGFDADVAAANGYEIVTYPDGSQQSVPADPDDETREPSAVLHPNSTQVVHDEKWGDCGYSFIEGDQVAPHTIWLRSGFKVNGPAIGFQWTIELQDENGISYQGDGHGLPGTSDRWDRYWDDLNQYGWSTQDVVSPSWVQKADGSICVSYGPGIFWYVTY
ncbi:hypothetical protein Afil01_21440 [Actinorhabdospora filicis]|uniref:Secreted protein n=1 Tax=Actinorhabdospora filicis TaxID=1785913 RepID=A0A9W6SJZ0_9ACTN|nr:hypothetical protein [Actinorhabdospora filicis]GLZ77337.1 hypothetical protein Afil01_21440 [Actinorhabdospora filicis]